MTPQTPLALTFLSPLMLAFAGLVGVPVLLYLWNRQRYKPMPWAAMAFIMNAVARNRRRLKLENLLLLLARILLVLLLVAAFSRPVLERTGLLGDVGEGRRNVVFVVDQSYSMGFQEGATTSFERARETAAKLARTILRDGDRFGLVLLGEGGAAGAGARGPFVYGDPIAIKDDQDRRRIVQDIKDLEPLAVPGDLARAFRAVADYLPRFDVAGRAGGGEDVPSVAGPKQVFVITDVQSSMAVSETGVHDPAIAEAMERAAAAGAEISFVDCGPGGAANVAVTGLRADAEVVAAGQPVLVTATVKSFAREPLDLELTLYRDRERTRDLPLRLEPGQEEQVELYVVFDSPGAHTASVEVRTDGLLIDNARYLTLDVRDGIEVALIDGEPAAEFGYGETDYLGVALAPGGTDGRLGPELIRPRSLHYADLEGLDLARHQVLVLANVIGLSQENGEAGRIEDFVRRGGGLLIFLGPQVDPTVWNEALWKGGEGLLPGRLGGVVERESTPDSSYFKLAAESFAHPVLQPFESREYRDLLFEPRFTGYVNVEMPEGAAEDPSRAVLARFEERRRLADGREVEVGAAGEVRPPALLERRFGRGRVLMFTSTADMKWSNFYAQYAYLMMAQRAVTWLAEAGAAERNLVVGDPFEAVLPAAEYVPEVLLTTPAQETLSLRAEVLPGDEKDRFRVAFDDTRTPGVYELSFIRRREGGDSETVRTDAFSVNVDPRRESDLAALSAGELDDLVPGVKVRRIAADDVDRAASGPEGEADGLEIWRQLIFAALGLLVFESFLGWRFGRRNAV